MAKLEDWVSDPKISQKLIDDLEKKLTQGEMEGLKDYLKDKKLKKTLCLTANDINKIRSNIELNLFLNQKEKAKFPKLVLGMFFEKDKASTLVENYDEEESMQINTEESGSSGYGSLSQSNDQLQLMTSLHTISSEKKTSDGESKNADLDCVLSIEELGSQSLQTREPTVIQKKDKLLPTEDLQEVKFENTPQTSDVPKSEKNVYDGHQNKHTFLPAVVDKPMQNKGLQELHCKERSGSDVINHPDVLDNHQGQIKHYSTSPNAVVDNLMQNEGQDKVQSMSQASSSVLERFNTDIKGQALNQSTPLNKSKKRNNNRKKVLMENKLKKMKEMTERDSVLRNWAMKQCSGSEGEIKEVFDCVLIRDVVEHSEYSFLKAENVMKYINPTAGVNKMIYFTDKNLLINLKTLLQFNMYVCDIPSTIILGLEERIINRSFSIDLYLRCISEVFVPALAVYKNIQRNKRLYSLI